MSPFGLRPDWKNSPAHLLLLSEFLRPRVSDDFVQSDCWRAALKEPPGRAIKRFLHEGALEKATLGERLDYKYRLPEMRSMLNQRGLGIEGEKRELAGWLAEADPAGMRAAVRGLALLRCSAVGQTIAQEFLAQKRESRASVENEVMNALLQGRLREATHKVAEFEAQQVLPRTVDGRWDRYNMDADFAVLKAIFQGRPAILAGLSEDQLQCLQLAAAMMHLCGSEECQAWLPRGFRVPLRIDSVAAARMILYSAYHRCNIASFLAAGTETVTVQTRHNPCGPCQTIAGKAYQLCDVPELPYQECAHELGCRCMMRAV